MTTIITSGCGRTLRAVSTQPLKLVAPLECPEGTLQIRHRYLAELIALDAVCRQCPQGGPIDYDARPAAAPSEVQTIVEPSIPLEDPRTEEPRRAAPSTPTPTRSRVVPGWRAAREADEAPLDLDGPEPPPLDELLHRALGGSYEGGSSLFGRTKIRAFRRCMRAGYWRWIVGVELKRRRSRIEVSPLDLGITVHLAIEHWYRDAATVWSAVEAIQGTYPSLATETRRLTSAYLRRFNTVERDTWDVRGLEVPAQYFYPPRKVGGKRRRLCVSTRIDGVYRSRRRGEPCLPPGEAADRVRLHEIKTTGHMTEAYMQGFYADDQLLQMLLCYSSGHTYDGRDRLTDVPVAELYGPATAITVSVIGKAQRLDLAKHLQRADYMLSHAQVERYRDDLGDWLYDDLGARLYSEHWTAPDTWPRAWVCKDPITGYLCDYAPICLADRDGVLERLYTRSPDSPHLLTPTSLEPRNLVK